MNEMKRDKYDEQAAKLAHNESDIAAALRVLGEELQGIKIKLWRLAGYKADRCACVLDETDTALVECDLHRGMREEIDNLKAENERIRIKEFWLDDQQVVRNQLYKNCAIKDGEIDRLKVQYELAQKQLRHDRQRIIDLEAEIFGLRMREVGR